MSLPLFLIVLVIPLGIVLSVRIPGDGEVIVLRNRCTVPIIVVPDLGVKIICLGIGGIGDGAGLDQDADSAVSVLPSRSTSSSSHALSLST